MFPIPVGSIIGVCNNNIGNTLRCIVLELNPSRFKNSKLCTNYNIIIINIPTWV